MRHQSLRLFTLRESTFLRNTVRPALAVAVDQGELTGKCRINARFRNDSDESVTLSLRSVDRVDGAEETFFLVGPKLSPDGTLTYTVPDAEDITPIGFDDKNIVVAPSGVVELEFDTVPGDAPRANSYVDIVRVEGSGRVFVEFSSKFLLETMFNDERLYNCTVQIDAGAESFAARKVQLVEDTPVIVEELEDTPRGQIIHLVRFDATTPVDPENVVVTLEGEYTSHNETVIVDSEGEVTDMLIEIVGPSSDIAIEITTVAPPPDP